MKRALKSVQRVEMAVKHELPDRVPLGELVVEEGFIEKYLRCERADEFKKAEFYKAVGLDVFCSSDLGEIAFFSCETDLFVFALVQGGFSGLLRACGDFMEAMLLLGRDPGAAGKIMAGSLDKSKGKAEQLLRSGANGVIIADDIAYDRGTYASPEALKEIYFPYLAETVKMIKENSCPVFFHSDGNLNKVLLELKQAGFDGLQCLEQRAGMDLGQLKKRFKGELCLMGGVDLENLGGNPSGDELEKLVRDIMLKGAPGGGYIFGTNGGIHEGLSPEVVRQFYRLAVQRGKY